MPVLTVEKAEQQLAEARSAVVDVKKLRADAAAAVARAHAAHAAAEPVKRAGAQTSAAANKVAQQKAKAAEAEAVKAYLEYNDVDAARDRASGPPLQILRDTAPAAYTRALDVLDETFNSCRRNAGDFSLESIRARMLALAPARDAILALMLEPSGDDRAAENVDRVMATIPPRVQK